MDMAMVGDLPHHTVDDEILIAVFGARYERERFGHERSFCVRADRPMLSEDGHRGIT